MIVQVPQQGQKKTYDGLELSVVRLDEDHILVMAPTEGEMKKHIVHTVDEAVEIFRSYLTRLMAQQEVERRADEGGQSAVEWDRELGKLKKDKGEN